MINLMKLFKKEKLKEDRKIVFFDNDTWGNSFVIDGTCNIGDKCCGYGFRSIGFNVKPQYGLPSVNNLVIKVMDDGVIVILITELTHCQDPKDMFFFKGIRLSVDDLTEIEKKWIEDNYDN